MFFDALKIYGLNFTRIGDAIGSNRFVVSTFYKEYTKRNKLPYTPMHQPVWTNEEYERVVQTIENHGEDYVALIKAVPGKSQHAIQTLIRRVTDKFDAKEDLSEFEQKLILALHKPTTVKPVEQPEEQLPTNV